MNIRACGYVFDGDKVLLINRYKKKLGQYYVVPGGKKEEGESLAEAAKRELEEETNLEIEIGKELFSFHRKFGKSNERHVFEVKSFRGEPKIIGEEAEQNSPENSFALEWVPLSEIQNINLVPTQHKEYLVKWYSNNEQVRQS